MLAIAPDSIGRRIIGVSMTPGGIVFTVMPLRRQVEGQRLGQRDDATLGGDVVRHPSGARLRGRGGDRHDATPAGVHHVGHHGLQAVERAREVDGHHPVPRLRGDVEEVLEALDPRAGDHDLHRPEGGPDLVECGVDGGPIAHVDRAPHGRRCRRPGAPCATVAAASPSMSSTPTRCPWSRQVPADGPAHAGATAGDHRDPAHLTTASCHAGLPCVQPLPSGAGSSPHPTRRPATPSARSGRRTLGPAGAKSCR